MDSRHARVIHEFARWEERGDHPSAGSEDAALLLDLLHRHFGHTDPAELRPGDLAEVLLEVFPQDLRAVLIDDSATVVPTVRALLAFLAETGRLSDEQAAGFTREVDEIESEFLDTMRATADWPPVRVMVDRMIADGVDLADPDGVQEWLDARGGADDRGPLERLPPVRLPDTANLAAAARGSELLAAARELGLWVGERRPVTESDELTAEDAAEAGRLTGATGSDLALLWVVAEAAEFIDFDDYDATARTGSLAADWPPGDDAAALRQWQRGLAQLLADPLGLGSAEDLPFAFTTTGMTAMVALLSGRSDGIPRSLLAQLLAAEELGEHPTRQAREDWAAWTAAHGDPAAVTLDRLARHGAVELVGDHARLTPLGTWAMREELRHEGIDIPLLPPVEQMSAHELVDAAESLTDDELTAERVAWLACRDAGAAAADLLQVAAEGTAAQRVFAVSVVNEVDAEAHWRQVAETLSLRPYAKAALGEDPDDFDAAWLVTDQLAASWSPVDPTPVVDCFNDVVPADLQLSLLNELWRLPHPELIQALEAIGTAHPVKEVAKAARKAAFKAANSARS
ncbi:hypothetical protein ACQPZF_03050 [Actinosynnema sp. CS-041913]|uniref:hypothetical protein n=1 Tax=Actinosynnema sp. CS-041913 TaxID=3239917 RepID=UPI003D92B7FF